MSDDLLKQVMSALRRGEINLADFETFKRANRLHALLGRKLDEVWDEVARSEAGARKSANGRRGPKTPHN